MTTAETISIIISIISLAISIAALVGDIWVQLSIAQLFQHRVEAVKKCREAYDDLQRDGDYSAEYIDKFEQVEYNYLRALEDLSQYSSKRKIIKSEVVSDLDSILETKSLDIRSTEEPYAHLKKLLRYYVKHNKECTATDE